MQEPVGPFSCDQGEPTYYLSHIYSWRDGRYEILQIPSGTNGVLHSRIALLAAVAPAGAFAPSSFLLLLPTPSSQDG